MRDGSGRSDSALPTVIPDCRVDWKPDEDLRPRAAITDALTWNFHVAADTARCKVENDLAVELERNEFPDDACAIATLGECMHRRAANFLPFDGEPA